jgi:simple sugar transport system permease protein
MSVLHNPVLIAIFAMTLTTATPLVLSAIGELMTQRAGIWNLGVEGTMLAAAFTAYAVVLGTGSLALATIAAIAVAALVGALTAALTAGLKLDHFVIGLTINLVADGLTLYLFRSGGTAVQGAGFTGFKPVPIPGLSQIPFLGGVLFDQPWLTYVAILLIPAAWLFLYRTRFGLELRVLGENPRSLETRGVPVMPRLWPGGGGSSSSPSSPATGRCSARSPRSCASRCSMPSRASARCSACRCRTSFCSLCPTWRRSSF